jgi:hypothetical protein
MRGMACRTAICSVLWARVILQTANIKQILIFPASHGIFSFFALAQDSAKITF